MDVNGNDDLRAPLLQPPDSVSVIVPDQKNDRNKNVRTIKFKIGDIKCTSCATSIESVLGELNGVESVMVSPLNGHAAITYMPELVTVSQLGELV